MGEGETGCRVSIRRRRVSDVRPGEDKDGTFLKIKRKG